MDARGRTGGRRGIRTHGGPEDLNSFRDCPIRPLWQPSGRKGSVESFSPDVVFAVRDAADIVLKHRCREADIQEVNDQNTMTDERAPGTSEPPIVFTMPSFGADDDMSPVDKSATVEASSDLDDLIARVTATVDSSADSVEVAAEEAVADVQPAGAFAPPTPDTPRGIHVCPRRNRAAARPRRIRTQVRHHQAAPRREK